MTIFKSTTEKLQTVEAQIEEAQARRLALATERDNALPEAVTGDPEAGKTADKADKALQDTERQLERLHISRAMLANRAEAEAVATRKAEAAARLKAAKRIAARRLDLLAELETTTAKAAALIAEINAAGVEMMNVAMRPRLDIHPANPASTENAIRVAMHKQGLRWAVKEKPMQDTIPTMAEAVAKLDGDLKQAEGITHE